MNLRHFNRINSRTLKRKTRTWCLCDRGKVGKYGKCLLCGTVMNKKKIFKKEVYE